MLFYQFNQGRWGYRGEIAGCGRPVAGMYKVIVKRGMTYYILTAFLHSERLYTLVCPD